jgi:hypothetical protein
MIRDGVEDTVSSCHARPVFDGTGNRAVLSGVAGFISSIRTSAANPKSRTGYELELIAIVRNLFLGREPVRGGRFLDRPDVPMMERVAADLLKQVGISKNAPPSKPISAVFGRGTSSGHDCAGHVF